MQHRNIGRITPRQQFQKLAVLAAAVGMLAACPLSRAASSLSWDPTGSNGAALGGGGNWDTTDSFWYNGAGDTAWFNADNDTAVFDGTAGIVTLTTPISAGGLTFNTDGYDITGNTLTLGPTPSITLGSGITATIDSKISASAATTITGTGSLALTNNTNVFTGGVTINGGANVIITASGQLGQATTAITLDGGELTDAATTAINGLTAENFVIGAGGATFNIVAPAAGGGGGKLNPNNATSLSGSGTITITGNGDFFIGQAENGFTGNWIINSGFVESGKFNALGSGGTVTINAGGELVGGFTGGGSIGNAIILNGGTLEEGKVLTTTMVSGAISVEADSTLRLGDYYDANNRNMTLSGNLVDFDGTHTGNLIMASALGGTAGMGAAQQQVAATGNILTLTGDNTGYTGAIVVDGNHILQFNSTNSVTNVQGNSSATAIPVVSLNYVGTLPGNRTISDAATSQGGGVLALNAQTNFNQALDMSTVGPGNWLLGSVGTSTYTASSLGVGTGNTYRLGGGGGTLIIPANILTGSAAVVIGDSRAEGGGTVIFTTNQNYTGGTTINGGILQLGNGGTSGNVTGSITINSPGVLAYDHSDNINIDSPLSGDGAIANFGSGSLTFNAANTLSLTASGILNIGVNGSFTAPTLTLAGGTVHIGNSTASDTFAATTINPGASMISGGFASGGETFALGAITRNTGGTVNFAALTAGNITTTNANTNGILGGWATYNGTTWAASDGSGPPGNIVAFAGTYTNDTWAAGNNTDDTISDAPASGSTTNTVRFNTAGANTLTLAGTNTITSGGVLETANVGANAVTITGGTLQAGGTNDLVINQFNTTGAMTISSVLAGSHGVTKSGPGTVVLANTAANTFTGNLYISGGTLAYTLDNNLGGTANQIVLNSGGTLDMAATGAITLPATRTINVGASGGGIEVQNSGDGGGGAKLTLGTANTLIGTGPITVTGLGILTLNAGQSYNGAGWIVNGGATPGGALEAGAAGSLGGTSVPVTINPNGELAVKNSTPNPITLNGGVLGADGTSGSFTGPINVAANSSIRTGFFFSATGNNLTISGPITGSGNLNLLNGQTWGPLTNPVPTQVAGDGHFLTLSGDLTGYTGSIIVNGGQGVLLNAANSVPQGNGSTAGITANASATGMPLVSTGAWNTSNVPTVTDNTGTAGGVFAINTGATNESTWFTQSLDMSNLGSGMNGYWFLGSQTGAIYEGGSLGVGANNTYRLGGGGGLLYVYNPVVTGNVTLQIGAAMVNGGGSVQFSVPESYTGPTNIVNGTLLMGNFDPSGPAEQDNTLPSDTVITFGGVNGTTQYAGTLDLQGDNQTLTAAQSLNVAAGANPASQVITSNRSYGGVAPTLTVDTSLGNTEWDGIIKDGTGSKVALTVTGTTPGNGVILAGNNNYTGLTTIDNDQFVQVGNGGSTGAITGPVQFNNSGSKLIINTSNSFTNNNVITGPGSITQNGTGTMTLGNAGNTPNTYSGGTVINKGKIIAANGTANGGSSIGTGDVTLNGGTLSLGPTSIPGNSSITGFGTNGAGWQVNNTNITGTAIASNILTLTDSAAAGNEARSAFSTTPQSISDAGTFTASFVYTESGGGTNPADGISFTIQSIGPNALGGTGGQVGYTGIGQSAGLELHIYGGSTTGLGQNGTAPPVESSTSPVVLSGNPSGDPINVSLAYDGPTQVLTETLTDSKTPTLTFTTTYTGVDYGALLGGAGNTIGTGYVGFTGGDGGSVATQTISNFSFSTSFPPPTYYNTWSNNINVAAASASGIEMNIPAASLGALTLATGSTLNVTPSTALSAGTAYTLTFPSAATSTGTETINVADNGTGKGAVILTALTGSGNITKGGGGILQLPGASSIPSVLTVNGGVVAVPYTGTSPVNNIAADIKAAYDKGAWDHTNPSGPTITTAAASKLGTTLGYDDTGSIVNVMYTWYGDLDLNGAVNGVDLTAMTAGNGSSWSQGDLNYDGVKNNDDWSLFLLGNAVQDGSITTGVPEPTTLGLLAAAGVLALRRRRSV